MHSVKNTNLPPVSVRVISERETAVRLNLALRTIQLMRQRGTGPRFIRLGAKRIGYTEVALAEWIAAREVSSTAAKLEDAA